MENFSKIVSEYDQEIPQSKMIVMHTNVNFLT